MRHNRHRIRRGAILAATLAATLLATAGPQPHAPEAAEEVVEVQDGYNYCRVDYTVKNRLRRVRGDVNTECGDECRFIFPCHTPPWGNWGVDSVYGGKIDGFQFAGWHPSDGWRQWNSCTGRQIESEFNDGFGRQKAAPDNERVVYTWYDYYNAGYRNRDACDDWLPEVRTFRDVELDHFELDGFDFDNFVATLEYGNVDISVECSSPFNCTGASDWYPATSTNGTGVSSEIQFSLETSFSY